MNKNKAWGCKEEDNIAYRLNIMVIRRGMSRFLLH